MWGVVNATPQRAYTRKTIPVPILEDTVWTPRTLLKETEKRNSLASPRSKPRTGQSVTSSYTGCIIRVPISIITSLSFTQSYFILASNVLVKSWYA